MRIEQVEKNDGIVLLTLKGDVDVNSAVQVKDIINRNIDEGRKKIVIDLTSVSYIDSSGIGALLSGKKKILEENGKIVFLNPKGIVLQLFEMSKLIGFLEIFENLEEAIQAFKRT